MPTERDQPSTATDYTATLRIMRDDARAEAVSLRGTMGAWQYESSSAAIDRRAVRLDARADALDAALALQQRVEQALEVLEKYQRDRVWTSSYTVERAIAKILKGEA